MDYEGLQVCCKDLCINWQWTLNLAQRFVCAKEAKEVQ